ncbi:hypothetical protein, partial [Burkholderia gladioli]|uniref:hypothetical protein n=1 Tax=Burkholderia gladioli TaxID=28095 RepID=UPI001ABB89EA
YRHNLFDRKALAFHGKPPPGSGSSLPQNSLSDWPRIPNADHPTEKGSHEEEPVHGRANGPKITGQVSWALRP